MKYVVSGYIGFDNFGDEAIAYVLSQKLKAEKAEKITFISSNPQKTSKLYGVDSCSMLRFFKAIKDSDVLISGGGSLLQDVTSIKSLFYYLAVIFTAIILGKKVYIFAQGIGPINSFLGKTLTKFALKRADKISVRDLKSQELLKNWRINSELVNDPIFDIEIHQNKQIGKVGVQLRQFYGVDNAFLDKLADQISKHFADKKIELISLQDSIDLKICNQFYEKLRARNITNIEIFNNLSINSAIDKISELEYLIAMRFHANVVGIKAGIKTLAINYDPKVQKLAQEYNLPILNMDCNNIEDAFTKLITK